MQDILKEYGLAYFVTSDFKGLRGVDKNYPK